MSNGARTISLKLLSFNVGYFLGFRSQRDWLRRPHRAVRASRSVERSGLDGFAEVVERETPEIIALQEVDMGSIRTTLGDQAAVIADRLDALGPAVDYRADCKYGPDRVVSSLPGFEKMSNAVYWPDGTGSAEAEYIPPGVKQLAHVLHHDEMTVISVHLPTTTGTRRDQLAELATLASEYERVVVVGDFNLFNGFDELSPLTDDLGFEIHSPGDTYTTANPDQAFDLLLSSPEVTVTECRVLEDVRFSDHLPITAELS